MKVDILISGFGGQGIMSLGKILAKIALYEGKHTSWFPSYGAEVRGGTAHCFVKIADSKIASPLIDYPDLAIILNQPSWEKFRKQLKNTSITILNSSLIRENQSSLKMKKISLPLSKMALACGSERVVNTISLGLISSLRPDIFRKQTIIKVLKETFPQPAILDINLKSFHKGESHFKQPV